MYLIEESQIPDTALPVARLRDHLRMGSGFVEDGLQVELLGGFLRAAMAAIEARTGKALLVRDFVRFCWRSPWLRLNPQNASNSQHRFCRRCIRSSPVRIRRRLLVNFRKKMQPWS